MPDNKQITSTNDDILVDNLLTIYDNLPAIHDEPLIFLNKSENANVKIEAREIE